MTLISSVTKLGAKDLDESIIKPFAILRTVFTVEDSRKALEAVKSIENSEYELLRNIHSNSTGKLTLKWLASDCKACLLPPRISKLCVVMFCSVLLFVCLFDCLFACLFVTVRLFDDVLLC